MGIGIKPPKPDEPAHDAGERALLVGWLRLHRDALARNCAGLEPEELLAASAPPSDLTLLGLVRHLTEMEHWFLLGPLTRHDPGPLYCTDDDEDGDLLGLELSMVEPSMATWRDHVARVDALLDEHALDDAVPGGTVRWLLLKVIQEYARHNGHADILRERLDGATGE